MTAGKIVDLASEAEGVESADPQDETTKAQPYKMQDLMQVIAEGSDLKRSDLRAAAGLVCDALGQALNEGRTISLPGLGKIMPRKRDSKPSGDLLTARIKLAHPRDPMAEPETGGSPENP